MRKNVQKDEIRTENTACEQNKKKAAREKSRQPLNVERMKKVLLLDDSVYINGPDFIVGIFDIFVAVSKLRSCGGFGGGRCFLNGAGGADEVVCAV